MQAVQSVTFPALSKIADDERKFAESYRQVVMIVAFVMLPMMAGLIVVAPEMVDSLLGGEVDADGSLFSGYFAGRNVRSDRYGFE